MSSPLLLIHGFTDTRRTWDPLIPLLEPHHEVIAPTLVGHRGGPPIPEDGARPLDQLVAGLEHDEFLDALLLEPDRDAEARETGAHDRDLEVLRLR